MKYHEPCSVANENCTSPAAYQIGGLGGGIYEESYSNGGGAKFECFSCGQPVCGKCSKKIDYFNYGKQRICDNCIEDWDLLHEIES